MYSTDIILLGSLNECDLDNLPRPFIQFQQPPTYLLLVHLKQLKEDSKKVRQKKLKYGWIGLEI